MTVQAVKFSNEKIRPAADMLAQLYNFANTVIDEWYALEGVKLLPNTSEVIADGSDKDGRTVITGVDANNVINRLIEFVADMENTDSAKLNTVLKPAVNTTR